MRKTIAIIGTLDTKGEELAYFRAQIEKHGCHTIVIDCGILGEPWFMPDITREQVAQAAGYTVDEVIALRHEGKAIRVMAEGAKNVVKELYERGQLNGLASIGVTIGTSLALEVFGGVPMLKVPKLILSNVRTTQLAPLDAIGMIQDVVIMQSVVDITGLNSILERLIENAAASMTSMVQVNRLDESYKIPLVGTCALGIKANKYQHYLKPMLAQRGYELISFHATGAGLMLEQLIEQDMFVAILDLNCHEIICELCGCWIESAGPNRLEAAGRKGVPHIVAPGATDVISWPTSQPVPERFRGRKSWEHNRLSLTFKPTIDEKALTGKVIAQKLNKSKGPTAVIFPLRGLSEFDKEGEIYYDPEGDKALLEELKRYLDARIPLVEVDAHINDQEFSEEVMKIFDQIIQVK